MSDELSKEQAGLNAKYQKLGSQRISLAEYQALKAKKAKKGNFKMPRLAKIILGTPFLILFGVGVLFVPYIIFSIATSTQKGHEPTDKTAQEEKAEKDRSSSGQTNP